MTETRKGTYAFWANTVAECVPLDPIRYVERELVSPDGIVVKVRVPVYPPFELASMAAEKTSAGGRSVRLLNAVP